MVQAEVNIGMLGHVDHGKTTLTEKLTGKWTGTHSEEIKRGISIRLGYAELSIYYCQNCKKYANSENCSDCKSKGEFKRKISFIDAPGHETLMTTVIAASSILDGALFLISANEVCPQPQTIEHLIVLNSIGIKNIVVVQTKVDLVSKEKALENYAQIKELLKGTVAEKAPIIPVSANYNVNLELLIEAIEETIPTPKRDEKAPLKIFISRSFDVNKPGTAIAKLRGGVIGGSVVQGVLKIGDEIEIKLGVAQKENEMPIPIKCKVLSLMEEKETIEEAKPGGLIAIGTSIDPALTKSDALIGSVIGHVGGLPEATSTAKVKYELIKRKDMENPPLKMEEILAININTATTVGVVTNLAKGIATIKLKKPIVYDKSARVALSRKFGQRWKLAGWGSLV